jgi:hypothetical protein
VRGRARGSSFRLQKSTSGAWLMPIGPRVKSPRTRSGSSPQRESSGGEGAPEAGSRAVSLRDRWRVRSVCESGHSRALVDGRRPGPGTPPSLTRRRQKRSWCFAEVRLVRAEAERETGRQRFSRRPCERPTTPSQWGCRPVGGARSRARARKTRRDEGCARWSRSWAPRRQAWAHLGPDRRKAVRRRSHHFSVRDPQGSRAGRCTAGGLRGASRRARESADPRVYVPWRRLQKSVRSTFSAAPRGAARRTEGRRRSAVGRFRTLDEGGIARLTGSIGREAGAGDSLERAGPVETSAARPAPGAVAGERSKGRWNAEAAHGCEASSERTYPLARASFTRSRDRESN